MLSQAGRNGMRVGLPLPAAYTSCLNGMCQYLNAALKKSPLIHSDQFADIDINCSDEFTVTGISTNKGISLGEDEYLKHSIWVPALASK